MIVLVAPFLDRSKGGSMFLEYKGRCSKYTIAAGCFKLSGDERRIYATVLCFKVEVYREGQRILERQRFQFPSSWLHVDNIEGEWGAFNEIIKRKDSSIQTQVQRYKTVLF
jgi:hypothetical protein